MKLIGVTGPSSFTSEVVNMVEEFFHCNPVLLYQNNDKNLAHDLARVDAVILAGGSDLHPMTYKQSCLAKKNMKSFDLRRDVREQKVVNYCRDHGIPMMGICRGHQLLGVLRMNLEMVHDIGEDAQVVHQPSSQEPKLPLDPRDPIHFVSVLNNKNLYGKKVNIEGQKKKPLYSRTTLWVNSFHHQGLLFDHTRNHPAIVGTAFVNHEKSIVELMINEEERWMSCQWHPEYDWHVQDSSRNFLEYFKQRFLNNDQAPVQEAS